MSPKLIGTEHDNLNNELKILHSETLTMSPVYPFFLRGLADLVDSGLRDGFKQWDDSSCGSIYAEQDGKIVGHLVYSKPQDNKILLVLEGAVETDFRRRGIYTLLYKHLEVVAKSMGFVAIAGNVNVNNHARISFSKKVGMNPVFYRMLKKL